MKFASNHVEESIEHLVTRAVHDALARLFTGGAVMLLVGSCAAAAVACGLAALWIFLLPYLGPVGAPLVVGGTLLLISLLIMIASRKSRHDEPPVPILDILPALAVAEATSLLKDHKGVALIAAVLAGLTSGRLEHK